jgi:hypothetical protein
MKGKMYGKQHGEKPGKKSACQKIYPLHIQWNIYVVYAHIYHGINSL